MSQTVHDQLRAIMQHIPPSLLVGGVLMCVLILWIGMRPRTLLILGFQGAGAPFYEQFVDSDPLIYAGHVGLSLDGGHTIWGFTPDAPHLSNRDLVEALKTHRTFPGAVHDDTAIFRRAAAYAAAGVTRTPVYVWRRTIPLWRWWRLRRRIARDQRASPLPTKRYGFPKRGATWYNCATWPRTLGVRIPERSGQLATYIPALARKGGEALWLPPSNHTD